MTLSLSAQSIVDSVKEKAAEISATGSWGAVTEGYAICAGLTIQRALEEANADDILPEDVIENLRLISYELNPGGRPQEVNGYAGLAEEGHAIIDLLREDGLSPRTRASLLDAFESLLDQIEGD